MFTAFGENNNMSDEEWEERGVFRDAEEAEFYTMCLDGRFTGWLIEHTPGGPQRTKGILGVGILEFSPSSTVLWILQSLIKVHRLKMFLLKQP